LALYTKIRRKKKSLWEGEKRSGPKKKGLDKKGVGKKAWGEVLSAYQLRARNQKNSPSKKKGAQSSDMTGNKGLGYTEHWYEKDQEQRQKGGSATN